LNKLSIALAVFGLLLGTVLVGAFGFHRVVATVLSVGWGGLALVCAWQMLVFVPLGLAWDALARARGVHRPGLFIWGRMVRDASINLLPFSQLGGFFFGARAVMLEGLEWPVATATTVVDVTAEFLAEVVFAGMGLAIVLAWDPATDLKVPLELGLSGAVLLVTVFIWTQRGASTLFARISGRIASRRISGAQARVEKLSTEFNAIYRARFRLAVSFLLHLVGWIGTGVGGWIAYRLLGARIDLSVGIAIEALVAAISAATFLVPLGAGILEAGYTGIGAIFGLPAEVSLAVSLLRRARDVTVGVPILLTWQVLEMRRLRAVAG
jgi:glycosyltransferase 2 family protein